MAEGTTIYEALQELLADHGEEYGIRCFRTFNEAGLMSGNLGLVLYGADDEEQQVAFLGTYGGRG